MSSQNNYVRIFNEEMLQFVVLFYLIINDLLPFSSHSLLFYIVTHDIALTSLSLIIALLECIKYVLQIIPIIC